MMPIDQRLELDRLLRMLEYASAHTKLNSTFNVFQLAALLRIHKDEPIGFGAYRAAYGLPSSRLSRVLEALCVLGLVTRRRDYDRRCVTIQMTEAGRKFVDELLSIHI